MAKARGFQVVAIFDEKISGVSDKRPAFHRMMAEAHRGQFQVLLVWSLDRLGRNMLEIQGTAEDLDRWGVRLVSAKESFLDVEDPMIRRLLLAQMAWVAEFERRRLIERTLAGLARARAAGTKLGRPRRFVDVIRARELAAVGLSIRKIARRLHVPRATLDRAIRGVSHKGATKRPPRSSRKVA